MELSYRRRRATVHYQIMLYCDAARIRCRPNRLSGNPSALQRTLQEAGWSSVVRTGSNITVAWDGDTFRCETVGACIKTGTLVE